MIDGADGTGKSTIVETWRDYLKQQGKKIFSLKDYWRGHSDLPSPAQWRSSAILFTAEPSYAGMGKIIREELIAKHEQPYPPEAVAHGFSLDRLILYRRIILPALKARKLVVQDRGVSTSLVYQPLQGDNLTIKKVAELPGNKQALKYAPNYLIITELDPKLALHRLNSRRAKNDNAIFENLSFIKKNMAAFHNPAFIRLMRKYGAKIVYFDTSDTIDIMKARAIKLLQSILVKD